MTSKVTSALCLSTSSSTIVAPREETDPSSVFVRQSHDVVCSCLPFECQPPSETVPSHPTSPTLKRVVDEFLELHRPYMTKSLTDLGLTVDNILVLYGNISREIVGPEGSPMTWGRVVLLYALAKVMAQMSFRSPSPQVHAFVEYVGYFVEKKASRWISQQGGWESIYAIFGNEEDRWAIPEVVHKVCKYAVKALYYVSPIPSPLLQV